MRLHMLFYNLAAPAAEQKTRQNKSGPAIIMCPKKKTLRNHCWELNVLSDHEWGRASRILRYCTSLC